MPTDDDRAAELGFLADLRNLAVEMATAPEPYSVASQMWSLSMGGMLSVGRWSAAPEPHWMIWAAFTDQNDFKDLRDKLSPEEKAQAVATMRRAATEWLAVADDRNAWSAYFDHWVYDECGYKGAEK